MNVHCFFIPSLQFVFLFTRLYQMQPVDTISMNELKRVEPEAVKGLLSISSIFNLEWTNTEFTKPIIVRLFIVNSTCFALTRSRLHVNNIALEIRRVLQPRRPK